MNDILNYLLVPKKVEQDTLKKEEKHKTHEKKSSGKNVAGKIKNSKTKLTNEINDDTNLKISSQNQKPEISKGQMFGLISGSVTTIGVIVGLWQSHRDISIIISAILSIALSDSFSDGFGMYFSQRTQYNQEISINVGLKTTFYKIIVTLSYILPFLILDIDTAVRFNISWGCFLISYASYQIGEGIIFNLFLSLIVILMSYLGGNIIKILLPEKNIE